MHNAAGPGAVGDERLRPFYFTAVFWGRAHRGYFTDLLLASLLAPRNIPGLRRERGSKFLIATTREDWGAVEGHPLVERLRAYAEPVWLELEIGAEDWRDERKMAAQSRGHALVAGRAYADGAYGVYIANDTVIPDGSVAAMERLVEAGKKVVLVAAIRFQYEGVVAALRRGGYLRPGEPLVVSPREAMRIGLGHLHSETRRYEFAASWFARSPISPYWRVGGGAGIVLHSFQWAPVVVDYGALGRHDATTFEGSTLDGDYVYRNFPDPADVHVVTDSDEIGYLSVTRESDRHLPLEPYLAGKPRWVTDWYKTQLIRVLKDSSVIDPLKRAVFPTPVYVHAGEVTARWARVRRRAAGLIARVNTTGPRDRLAGALAVFFASELLIRDCPPGPRGFISWCWRYRRFLWQRAKERAGLARTHSRWNDGTDWPEPAFGWLNPIWSIRYIAWPYRRFMWQRAKERVGLMRGRSRLGDGRDWVAPAPGLVNPIWTARWTYRHRRYLWRRMKENVGLARGYSRVDDGRDWVTPALGLMNPIWSARWAYRYRRYLWQRAKERLGLAHGRASLSDGRDWVTPVLGIINPVWSVRWVWRYRRFVWQRAKEKARLARGCSLVNDRDWTVPAMGLMNPIWSLRMVLARLTGATMPGTQPSSIRSAGADERGAP